MSDKIKKTEKNYFLPINFFNLTGKKSLKKVLTVELNASPVICRHVWLTERDAESDQGIIKPDGFVLQVALGGMADRPKTLNEPCLIFFLIHENFDT